MSATKVRVALETALAAMTPALATIWENKSSAAPVRGTPWQEPTILFSRPGNTALGANYYQERGVFQVALHYPSGNGAGAAEARAELIRAAFPRGSSFTSSGVSVRIPQTPRIGKGFTDTNHQEWILPVTVSFEADVFL